jgi:hypothetical protein
MTANCSRSERSVEVRLASAVLAGLLALSATTTSAATDDFPGYEAKSAPPSAFGDLIRADVALWAKVVKETGITAD